MSEFVVPYDPMTGVIVTADRNAFVKHLRAHLPDNPRCAELGIYRGEFSRMLLSHLRPSKLLLIDPFETSEEMYADGLPVAYSTEKDYRHVVKSFDKEIKSGQVEVIKQSSFDAVKDIVDHSLDMVYIDACHKYESVKCDLEDWLPKIKCGGIISGHDYFEHKDFGVIAAVNEFCKENKFQMILFNNDGNDFALKRI